METRSYSEAIRFSVDRLMDAALTREAHGFDAEANAIYFTNELTAVQFVIGFVYRTDLDTVIEDLNKAVGSYGGKVPKLKMPDFIEEGE